MPNFTQTPVIPDLDIKLTPNEQLHSKMYYAVFLEIKNYVKDLQITSLKIKLEQIVKIAQADKSEDFDQTSGMVIGCALDIVDYLQLGFSPERTFNLLREKGFASSIIEDAILEITTN